MTATADLPAITRTALRDFLAVLIDDAWSARVPDGVCGDCRESVTSRCAEHQDDDERAAAYDLLYQAVKKTGSDEEALAVFVAGLPGAGGES